MAIQLKELIDFNIEAGKVEAKRMRDALLLYTGGTHLSVENLKIMPVEIRDNIKHGEFLSFNQDGSGIGIIVEKDVTFDCIDCGKVLKPIHFKHFDVWVMPKCCNNCATRFEREFRKRKDAVEKEIREKRRRNQKEFLISMERKRMERDKIRNKLKKENPYNDKLY